MTFGTFVRWGNRRSASFELIPLVVLLCMASRIGLAQDESSSSVLSPSLSQSMERLLSSEPQDHDEALNQIVSMGESAVAELETIAVDPSAHPRYRSGAVFALGRIGAESSREVLANLWNSGLEALGGALAIQVATALGWYGEFDPLRQMVSLQDPILGAKAAVQLGLLGDLEAVDLLGVAYESEEYARMRPFFAIALGLLGDGRGEAILRAGLSTLELRNHCAVALSRLGFPEEVLFELEFAMQDPDPLVRRISLEALIAGQPHNLDEILDRAQEDTDVQVRRRAAEVLERSRRRQHRPR